MRPPFQSYKFHFTLICSKSTEKETTFPSFKKSKFCNYLIWHTDCIGQIARARSQRSKCINAIVNQRVQIFLNLIAIDPSLRKSALDSITAKTKEVTPLLPFKIVSTEAYLCSFQIWEGIWKYISIKTTAHHVYKQTCFLIYYLIYFWKIV